MDGGVDSPNGAYTAFMPFKQASFQRLRDRRYEGVHWTSCKRPDEVVNLVVSGSSRGGTADMASLAPVVET